MFFGVYMLAFSGQLSVFLSVFRMYHCLQLLVATFSSTHSLNRKGSTGGGNGEVEKGLLTLISSDVPGLQVLFVTPMAADSGFVPGDLLFLTGKALIHATTGLRPTASHRSALDIPPGTSSGERTSLVFRLMPQGNAILDCSPIAAAGHVIPQSYVPISVTQFMDAIIVLVMCQSL
ncbi:unnamed protein product [Coffea canephora]|uniref:Uncharacterized protein n=1 Tax=Coffea canephora TaxID=49390 RepID=A0A068URK6_COFCA|nr:unnamed protein product [Coffea canephora]